MEFDSEINGLKPIQAALHSKIESLKAALAEAKAIAAYRLEQLKVRDFKADLLRSTLSELDDLRTQLEIVKKENEVITIQTQIRVRAKLMRQWKDGKSDTWDREAVFTKALQKTIANV